MNAIFGIVNKNGSRVDADMIATLQQSMLHRCAAGTEVLYNDHIALGGWKSDDLFRASGKEVPFENEHIAIITDSRIDNKDELYNNLNIDKTQWSQQPDAALIFKAYQKWNKKCADHLDGEYVIAILDKSNQELIIFTDRIGYRPVYYCNTGDQFIFCSEIKGIEAVKKTSNYFNEERLIDYHFRNGDAAATFNKDIFALCGGNMLTLNNGYLKISKYWTLAPQGKYKFKKNREWVDCFRDLLYRSVEKRVDTSVPIGVTLSGGIDSTSITCILSEILRKENKPLYTFSSVLPEQYNGIEKDERRYVDIVNRFCPNIVQTYINAFETKTFENIEDAFNRDEAFPNPFFNIDAAILDAAQQKNVKNLFTGYGGDFWVSSMGSSVPYNLILNGKIRTALKLLVAISKVENRTLASVLKTQYLGYTALYNSFKKKTNTGKVNWQRQTFLKEEFTNNYTLPVEEARNVNNSTFMQEYINKGNMSRILFLLKNRNSHFQITSSVPMFDKDLNEFLIELPIEAFLTNGYKRGLIKTAMKDIIPNEILNRSDKLPYAPGYQQRILNDLPDLGPLDLNAQLFNKYFDKELLQTYTGDIRPMANFTESTDIVAIRFLQYFIANATIDILIQKNYTVH